MTARCPGKARGNRTRREHPAPDQPRQPRRKPKPQSEEELRSNGTVWAKRGFIIGRRPSFLQSARLPSQCPPAARPPAPAMWRQTLRRTLVRILVLRCVVGATVLTRKTGQTPPRPGLLLQGTPGTKANDLCDYSPFR